MRSCAQVYVYLMCALLSVPKPWHAGRSLPHPSLEQQPRGKSPFLFLTDDVSKDTEPGRMCAGIRIDWGLVINLFRP